MGNRSNSSAGEQLGSRVGRLWISDWKGWFVSNWPKEHAGLYIILAIYLFPVFLVLTTFPIFYDDESWLYLSPIEALRGNGFTWAAFGQGHSAAFTFDAIAYALLRLSPFSLVPTIRLISTGAGAFTLVAAYLAARHLAPRAALIAPSLLALTSLFYWLSRYGRSDSLSLLLSTASIWLSLAERPMLAGIGAGFSTSLYPLNGWVACFDAFISQRKRGWKGLARCGSGIAIGVSWQLYGIAKHFQDFVAINRKYAASASLRSKSGLLLGIVQSAINERGRYSSYLGSLFQRADYSSLFALAVTIGCLLLSLRSARRWIAILLVVMPLASMAVLVGLKNPYEFIFCLPSMAIASAIGADYLPRPIFRAAIACTFALIVVLLWPLAIPRIGAARPEAVFATVAHALPEGSVVISPVYFAPIMEERPDIRFFTYHVFSPHDDWSLPECRAVPQFIREVVQNDARQTSQKYLIGQTQVPIYFIWLDGFRLGYLRLIWPDLSDQQAECFMPMSRVETDVLTVRGRRPEQDDRTGIGRLDLDGTP